MSEGTSICLVTRDRPDTLQATISALLEYAAQPYEIIIVDNGSTSNATLSLLAQSEKLGHTVVREKKNEGLAFATNYGFHFAKYDTLIHLDDDCLIKEHGWNQRMRGYLTAHEKIGLVVPSTTQEYIQHPGYREIRWGLGMCWAMRKGLFEDIGAYDKQLLHQLECDLALRVRMAGFHVAGIQDVKPHHNDPGGERSEVSKAREHIGVVQFRDKWCEYFYWRGCNYGSLPLRLMQHWPPDQDFYRRYALAHGVDLNPHPVGGVHGLEPGARLGLLDEDASRIPQKVQIDGHPFCVYATIRPDFSHYIREGMGGDSAYDEDRDRAIARWKELTGEEYTGYKFAHDPLRVE